MKKRTLIIAEMLCNNITNGVSRYAEMLHDGLPKGLYNIIYLKFVFFQKIALPKSISHKNYIELVVPLPVSSEEIIGNDYWFSEYNKLVEHLIEPFLKQDFIFHIQTMNLINLAVYLRKKYKCKVVSHIHCIPWKYKYSSNQQLFNQIYYRFYVKGSVEKTCLDRFVTPNEFDIIRESDAIICVTQSAKKYYEKYLHAIPEKVSCIYNGIRDELSQSPLNEIKYRHNEKEDGLLQLLYAGNVTKDKGFPFVLKALRKVSDAGYKYVLMAAGTVERDMQKLVKEEYSDLNIRLLGHVDYTKLRELYQFSHIGIISSLFEQCSYVAIEMSMYGLPVVYSDIEGLDEIFDRNDNMSVPVNFSIHSSLNLDVNVFASKIIKLMKSSDLRKEIGDHERNRFIRYFNQEYMIQRTIEVYNKLYQE